LTYKSGFVSALGVTSKR